MVWSLNLEEIVDNGTQSLLEYPADFFRCCHCHKVENVDLGHMVRRFGYEYVICDGCYEDKGGD
jgi:hypothetical protein